jgi:RNA polymerase sigma-70 factor (ECF subfamily)
MHSSDSPASFRLLNTGVVQSSSSPSTLEEEVVQFFNEFRNPLMRYVLSMRLDTPDAEEVVQEVFLALFRHLQQGRPRTSLRGWIFRVGHNLALKQRIRNGRRDRLESHDDLSESRITADLNPEEEFEGAQRQEILLAAVGMLSDVDRGCLYLRAEGLRYREIADVLGISLGGVSLALGRALTKLSQVDGQ